MLGVFSMRRLFVIARLRPTCSKFNVVPYFEVFFQGMSVRFLSAIFVRLFCSRASSILYSRFIANGERAVRVFSSGSARKVVVLKVRFHVRVVVCIVRVRKAFSSVFPIKGLLSGLILLLVMFIVSLARSLLRSVLRYSRSNRVAMFVRRGNGIRNKILRFRGGVKGTFYFMDRVQLSRRVVSGGFLVFIMGGGVLRISSSRGIILTILVGQRAYRLVLTRGVSRLVVNKFCVHGNGVCS